MTKQPQHPHESAAANRSTDDAPLDRRKHACSTLACTEWPRRAGPAGSQLSDTPTPHSNDSATVGGTIRHPRFTGAQGGCGLWSRPIKDKQGDPCGVCTPTLCPTSIAGRVEKHTTRLANTHCGAVLYAVWLCIYILHQAPRWPPRSESHALPSSIPVKHISQPVQSEPSPHPTPLNFTQKHKHPHRQHVIPTSSQAGHPVCTASLLMDQVNSGNQT